MDNYSVTEKCQTVFGALKYFIYQDAGYDLSHMMKLCEERALSYSPPISSTEAPVISMQGIVKFINDLPDKQNTKLTKLTAEQMFKLISSFTSVNDSNSIQFMDVIYCLFIQRSGHHKDIELFPMFSVHNVELRNKVIGVIKYIADKDKDYDLTQMVDLCAQYNVTDKIIQFIDKLGGKHITLKNISKSDRLDLADIFVYDCDAAVTNDILRSWFTQVCSEEEQQIFDIFAVRGFDIRSPLWKGMGGVPDVGTVLQDNSDDKKPSNDSCPICLQDIYANTNAILITLSCGHRIHRGYDPVVGKCSGWIESIIELNRNKDQRCPICQIVVGRHYEVDNSVAI